MNNDLKNFLDEMNEYECKSCYYDNNLTKHNCKLINFVLDLVDKEVGKLYKPYEGEDQIMIEHHILDKVSTIINNLRV